jgi:hypothetical protein
MIGLLVAAVSVAVVVTVTPPVLTSWPVPVATRRHLIRELV